jgi:hypothetical protein
LAVDLPAVLDCRNAILGQPRAQIFQFVQRVRQRCPQTLGIYLAA